MLEIKGETLQYIYQNNEREGVIIDIHTFESVMGALEDYEDSMDFELLKTEETMDYEDYRRRRLKHGVWDQDQE